MAIPGNLAALFLDATTPAAAPAEIAWYGARLPRAGLVLLAPCGVGRLAAPLAAAGVELHALDPSAALLERCERRLAALGHAATLLRQELPHLNLPFRYAAAIVPDGALQTLTHPAAAAAALARLRAHLIAPAMLIVDCRVPSAAQQRLAAPLVELRTAPLADGSRLAVRSETTWTPEARMTHGEHRYSHRRGPRQIGEERATQSGTWYTPDEMLDLVRAAGYRDARVETAPVDLPAEEAFAVIAGA